MLYPGEGSLGSFKILLRERYLQNKKRNKSENKLYLAELKKSLLWRKWINFYNILPNLSKQFPTAMSIVSPVFEFNCHQLTRKSNI